MIRRYGRAKRGHRLVAAVPHGHWKTTTFVGALRCDGLTAPLTIDGAINGELFLAYVEQVLVSTLKRVSAGRYRHHGQPASPQNCRRSRSNRGGRCKAAVHSALQPRSEPNRVGVLQAQIITASQSNPDRGCVVEGSGGPMRQLQSQRVRQLLPPRRLFPVSPPGPCRAPRWKKMLVRRAGRSDLDRDRVRPNTLWWLQTPSVSPARAA